MRFLARSPSAACRIPITNRTKPSNAIYGRIRRKIHGESSVHWRALRCGQLPEIRLGHRVSGPSPRSEHGTVAPRARNFAIYTSENDSRSHPALGSFSPQLHITRDSAPDLYFVFQHQRIDETSNSIVGRDGNGNVSRDFDSVPGSRWSGTLPKVSQCSVNFK